MQIRLSTLLWVVAMAGVLVWMNVQVVQLEPDEEWFKGLPKDSFRYPLMGRGWPIPYDLFWMGVDHTFYASWRWSALLIDTVIAISALLVFAVLIEYRSRNKDRRLKEQMGGME